VHVAIVLIFFGFAGEGLGPDEVMINLLPGQQTTIGDYAIRHDRLQVTDDAQKQAVTAFLTIFKNGEQVAELYPARWFFHKSQQPTTEAAIRRTIPDDLHIVLGNFEIPTQAAHLQINVNPLVNWVWFGFGVLAFGTGIALLPERAFVFALSKLPASEAATSSAALLLMLALAAAPLRAQSTESPHGGVTATEPPVAEGRGASPRLPNEVVPATTSPLERQMLSELVCMCGGCKSPLNDCPMMQCHSKDEQKAMLHTLVEEGKNHDEIVAAFVQRYGGQDVLGAPIDEGFNRLAWLFPYLVGVSGAAALGLVAVRLSKRRSNDDRAAAPEPVDPTVEERLDDELRDLD
jgi:cytochrome c-type biogenesis protein CcmF